MELLQAHATEIVIPVCAAIGIAFSVSLLLRSRNIDGKELLSTEEPDQSKARYIQNTEYVSEGVTAFLFMECLFIAVFMVGFAMLIFILFGYVERFSTHSRPCDFYPSNMCKPAYASAVSFLFGALASAFSGFLGAWTGLKNKSGSFCAAFRNGAAMGFILAAIGLLGLYIAIIMLKRYYGNDWEGLFEAITGYGLGASSMAFFGRTGGGIYAKAADVCHRRGQKYLPTHRRDRRPTVITLNVGDIVGDIAGTGTDLFGSYAQSSCAALAVASMSSFGIDHDFTAMCYPLLISSMGILVCFITTLVGETRPAKETNHCRDPAMETNHCRDQLIISTILMSGGIVSLNWIALPSLFKIDESGKDVKNWQLSLCVGVGLWAGSIARLRPGYDIINATSYLPNVNANRGAGILTSGPAVLGFIIIPIYADISIGVSFYCAATYGIALAALGMLSTTPTRLAIDAYDPIRRCANRIAQIARRENSDIKGLFETDEQKRYQIGPKSPAITGKRCLSSKGFAIESTALVSIALFAAFARSAKVSFAFWDFQTLEATIGFILGNFLPHVFSDMTMRSVGRAGLKMAPKSRDGLPKYIKFPTDEFLWGLIGPGALVMLTPVIVGTFFGADALFGVLVGSLSSVLLIAVSQPDDDGALKKANKSIRDGALENAETLREAAGGEGIVDDPQKDTSGPPLNILVQLMALESLVFAPFFASHGGLLWKFL